MQLAWNYRIAETAVAIMDALVDALASNEIAQSTPEQIPDGVDLTFETRVRHWYDAVGRMAMRSFAIEEAAHIECVWDALDEETRDGVVWDYEFIPGMLALYDFEAANFGDGRPARPDMFAMVLTAQRLQRLRTDPTLASERDPPLKEYTVRVDENVRYIVTVNARSVAEAGDEALEVFVQSTDTYRDFNGEVREREVTVIE